jgi:hypothetical protein
LNPEVPALAQQSVSPRVSVMVTVVLLKVACMWATPTVTLRRGFLFLLFDTFSSLPWFARQPGLAAAFVRIPSHLERR